MAKKKNKRGFLRPYVKGAFTPIEDDLLLSRAFLTLPPGAVNLLLLMLRIDKMLAWKEGDSYRGEFNLTFTEAAWLGLSRSTTGKSFKELEKRGFIEVVLKGGLKSNRKTSSIYRIIERWRSFGGLMKLKELEGLKECGKCP